MRKELFIAHAKAKPFLKWAGGKTQLLEQMTAYFPPELSSKRITRYVEPFVGSGAMFFYVAQNYPAAEFFLLDVNKELVLAYQTIQQSVEAVICRLEHMRAEYVALPQEKKADQFYAVRDEFNRSRSAIDFDRYQTEWIERTAQIVFLNRTCFNGLFRVNARGDFNVPFGGYKNPQIANAENLRAVSRILQGAKIQCADFEGCERNVHDATFVYFDPPYRPISPTASFTSYARFEFGDKEQKRLAHFYRTLDERGAKLMLSNSDPKNENPDDHFFEALYKGFNIKRVRASRMINCDATKRGKINELLIMNYQTGYSQQGMNDS
ncbi:MAG: modification methylase [Chloroflexi bacterium]|nr:MAG: modification methylase [Chloroflexota bacterium]